MKKLVSKLRQEVKVKVDIVTNDDIKIYYTGKFQDFTARHIMKKQYMLCAKLWQKEVKWIATMHYTEQEIIMDP